MRNSFYNSKKNFNNRKYSLVSFIKDFGNLRIFFKIIYKLKDIENCKNFVNFEHYFLYFSLDIQAFKIEIKSYNN